MIAILPPPGSGRSTKSRAVSGASQVGARHDIGAQPAYDAP
jgi:hypothetical protein